jgi:hypothetical protein
MFKLLIKQEFESDENIDVPDISMLYTFEEEIKFLDSDAMLIIKRHYVTHYRQLKRIF